MSVCAGGCSAGSEAESNVSNVRRENKLYSYKEQMADIELRKVSLVLHYYYYEFRSVSVTVCSYKSLAT